MLHLNKQWPLYCIRWWSKSSSPSRKTASRVRLVQLATEYAQHSRERHLRPKSQVGPKFKPKGLPICFKCGHIARNCPQAKRVQDCGTPGPSVEQENLHPLLSWAKQLKGKQLAHQKRHQREVESLRMQLENARLALPAAASSCTASSRIKYSLIMKEK